MTTALLALADGRVFRGRAFGHAGRAVGEVVFNTSMTGYQEILTDPSYEGQLVSMTYPEIGNYGINPEDVESRRPWVRGFIVKEACRFPSSWRSTMTLGDYLARNEIVGIEGIDTRALTRHLREAGSMMGVLDATGSATAISVSLMTDSSTKLTATAKNVATSHTAATTGFFRVTVAMAEPSAKAAKA